ncbi:PREDICTED: uncharacterized protein LOC109584280 [Amphimedon queenslandica]|uniref:Uncharacterized protein n=1 Tax=Amphimedon queenslandica TaxID=400682 RepID=A0AAN0JFV0_AMPQE|nr:PREDICTED: uncharacterized protein LOC109584280 [Amphimedon queenslandica]|eukprot:XP_019855518.1 PREDICTED: uncharacterized protein LOC109584280 [Amphimedon queenslandica]
MAKAISIRDLKQQVAKLCPEGTPIPSDSWVRYNFLPRNVHTHAARHYRGRLEAKHMIQRRQFRKSHIDAHYCSALFRYMREYAITLRDIAQFVCIDDKHRIKVGEPGFPVAAVERGREVIVSLNETYAVGDHDFTKFSVIPSVTFLVDIPESMDGSWYRGQVFIGIKDAIFEPSSPLRHATELYHCLLPHMANRFALFLYSDGGPDHRLTYVSVQLSLIALFYNFDLDILVACRTAPSHSWANPVERMMSVINLGLQCIGIMRTEMGKEIEKKFEASNNLKELRANCVDHQDAVIETLKPVKELLNSTLQRLELKGKAFQIFDSASKTELEDFWSILLVIEPLLTEDSPSKEALKSYPSLVKFIQHCCSFKKYAVTIKKCGQDECPICKTVRMPMERFSNLYTLPNPVIGEDGHYKDFQSVIKTDTSNSYAPSELTKNSKANLGFNVTQQHAKNTGTVIQCEECSMWRLIFSKKKLSPQGKADLSRLLDDISYTCGAAFDEINLPESLNTICIKTHNCHDKIEKLYYSSGFEPICIHCGTVCTANDSLYYPQCSNCRQPKIKKLSRGRK